MRSTRSCSRARTSSQRGFALLWAIGIAVLFFMLIELMLLDSARELKEARRFRERMVAQILAENGAELAAVQIFSRGGEPFPARARDWQGTIKGSLLRDQQSGKFVIVGEGEATGADRAKAKVEVEGVARGADIDVDFTIHTP